MTLRNTFVIIASILLVAAHAQWLPYNSGLQTVRSITTQNGDIYAMSFPSGVHKSTNDGLNWNPVMNGLPTPGQGNYVRSVGSNATHLFAGTEAGIYRSANGGTSWEIANGSLTSSNLVFANKFFHFGNTTFAVFTGNLANGGGIYRTVNNGNTWLLGHSGMSANMVVYHLTYDNYNIYAATNLGTYVSPGTLGTTWNLLDSNSNYAYDTFSIQKAGNRLVKISSFGYRYSDNEGGSWTTATGSGIPANITKGELIAYNGNLYAITGQSGVNSCLISTNNGVSYTPYTDGLTALSQFGLEKFHASGTNLFIGTIQDLYRIVGTTVGLEDGAETTYPAPYPTLFDDGFQLDLSAQDGNSTLVLLDALGREVLRRENLPATPVRIERGTLVAGRYLCMLVNPKAGTRMALGTVIAQ